MIKAEDLRIGNLVYYSLSEDEKHLAKDEMVLYINSDNYAKVKAEIIANQIINKLYNEKTISHSTK